MERDYIQRAGALTDEEIIDKTRTQLLASAKLREPEPIVQRSCWFVGITNGGMAGVTRRITTRGDPSGRANSCASLTHMQHVPTCVLSEQR